MVSKVKPKPCFSTKGKELTFVSDLHSALAGLGTDRGNLMAKIAAHPLVKLTNNLNSFQLYLLRFV